MARIAIIGAGFSGTLLALHLLRRCPAGSKITLIEHRPQFGRGTAYAAGNPNHLLNVPAGRMSAFHDRPRDFIEWLERRPDFSGEPPLSESSFVPRQLFGDYIRHLLNREIKAPAHAVSLTLAKGDAQRIEQTAEEMVVHFDRRRAVHADLVVLAVGNFPPDRHQWPIRAFTTAPSIVPIPGPPMSSRISTLAMGSC